VRGFFFNKFLLVGRLSGDAGEDERGFEEGGKLY